MSAKIIPLFPMAKETAHLPNRIREHRLARKMTLDKLAEEANVHYSYMQKIELGQRPLKDTIARKIGKALNLDIGQLLHKDDNPDSLSNEEREVVSAMRSDPQFAHTIATLAEARATYVAPGKVEPLTKSG